MPLLDLAAIVDEYDLNTVRLQRWFPTHRMVKTDDSLIFIEHRHDQ